MSASILWEPINPNPKSISTWAPSSFQEAMEAAGLGLPCTMGKSTIPVLKGMAAVFGEPKSMGYQAPNPYTELIKIIEKHGDISVWAEH